MKNKLIASLILVIILPIVFSGVCVSQTLSPTEETIPPESEINSTANVNFQQVKVVSQDKNKLKISFELANNDAKMIAGIRYSIYLTPADDGKNQERLDFKNFSQEITLNPNQKVSREIEYEAPGYLFGEYDIWLKIEGFSGLPLSMAKINDIKLEGNQEVSSIEVNPSECYFQVKKENNISLEKYEISKGIFLKADENLVLNCTIKNKTYSQQDIFASFDNYVDSFSGSKVEEQNQNYAISLASNEKKQINLDFPKAQKPHFYDGVVSFKKDQKDIADKIIFHYFLDGASASIRNLGLDKNNYKKGDPAEIFIVWSQGKPASYSRWDNSVEEDKYKLELQLSDSEGNNCADILGENLTFSDSDLERKILVLKDCLAPKITAMIKDEEGNLLDKKEAVAPLETEETELAKTQNKDQLQRQNASSGKIIPIYKIAILFFAGIVAFILLLVLIKRRKNSATFLFIFFILVISFLLDFKKAEAYTATGGDLCTHYEIMYGFWDCSSGDCFVNNTGHFYLGETMNVYVQLVATGSCSDSVRASIGSYYIYNGDWMIVPQIAGKTYYLNADTGRGTIKIYVARGSTLLGEHSLFYYIKKDGVCGVNASDYGFSDTNYPGTTNADFCSVGTANSTPAFPLPGQTVSWRCTGIYDGLEATCSASRNSSPINGVCGTRNKLYESNVTAWPVSDTTCASGTPPIAPNPVFPVLGGRVTWSCAGLSGGVSASCSASRRPSVTLYASESPITLGDDVTLTRNVSGATSCTATTTPPDGTYWSGNIPVLVGNIDKIVKPGSTGLKKYDLVCFSINGILSKIATAYVDVKACEPDCGDTSTHCKNELWLDPICGEPCIGEKFCCEDDSIAGAKNTCIGENYCDKCLGAPCEPGEKDCTWRELAP